MHDLVLSNTLASRKKNFELRELVPIQQSDGVYVYLDGQRYLSFSSNNYLGLSNHPEVIQACQMALKKLGVGSGSAYLISGYANQHHELEERLADFLKYPRVLLFSCGYMANAGIISALFNKHSIFADKLNHASLVDGCLSSSKLKRYPHCNMAYLQKLLMRSQDSQKLIVSEGLFGMDGTLAPLQELYEQCKLHQSRLLIDDAHGIGSLGEEGRGTLELAGLGYNEIPILVGTLGKAFGTYGAFVASSDLVIQSIIQLARTYLYTTAIPPAIAAASCASLKIIQEEPWRRHKIRELVLYFQKVADQLGIRYLPSSTQIQLIMLRDSQTSMTMSEQLLHKGILVKAIRPPTVPRTSARLRVSITSEHTRQQIDYLMEGLQHALAENKRFFRHGDRY